MSDQMSDDDSTTNEQSQSKRKRGRPRKNQSISHSEKKKRGRKPKDAIKKIIVSQKYEKEDDEIILHLAINPNDLKKYGGNISETSDIIDKIKNSSSSNENNVFTINDLSYESSSEDTPNENTKVLQKQVQELLTKVKMLEDEVKKLIEGCGQNGGYIVATGCECSPDISIQNLMAMKRAVKKYGYFRA